MPGWRILVVEDEPAVRGSLRAGLEAEGWEVIEAANRHEMFAALETGKPDLVTLDLGLGEEDGLALSREMRVRWNIPTIMINGKGGPIDRVAGLEHGADDYIVKPFHIREIVLRIRMAIERYQDVATGSGPLGLGTGRFDGRSGTLQRADGSVAELTGMEQRILALFLRNSGRIFSRDEISQALYGRDWVPLDRTIDGHMARLRRKLDLPGEQPSPIRSVRGVGYVFTGGVKPVPSEA